MKREGRPKAKRDCAKTRRGWRNGENLDARVQQGKEDIVPIVKRCRNRTKKSKTAIESLINSGAKIEPIMGLTSSGKPGGIASAAPRA